MARIACGGIQHETNTFADSRATLADFLEPDAWPGLVRGAEIAPAVAGSNIPVAGFIDEARVAGHELQPLLWCSAQPSGRVTREAFETIAAELLARLSEALFSPAGLDGVYLDLHGSMAAEHVDDADGELLARVRALLGDRIPLVASIDFHANAGGAQAHEASALVSYRSYPHVDMAETGARAARFLGRLIDARCPRPGRRILQMPFLVPLTAQSTLAAPMDALVDACRQLERPERYALSLTPGFPLADLAHTGPTVCGAGLDEEEVAHAVEDLAREFAANEPRFARQWCGVSEAVAIAAACLSRGEDPVVLAETQDNPGIGGDADTTSVLKSAIAAGLPGILAGIYCDPDAAARAHAAGAGASFEGEVAGRLCIEGDTPLRGRFRVVGLGDGELVGTGPFYRGTRMSLGPMAQIEHAGAHLVVASRRQQAADQAMFRHVGVEPARFRVLLLKSSVHFRADFGALARRIVVVLGPGRSPADPAVLPWRNLRAGVRLRPGG